MASKSKSHGPHGPVGTKLGTFIVDENLTIENNYVALPLYDKYLIDSITIGLAWIGKKIKENAVDAKYLRLYQKFCGLLQNVGYTDELNQSVIEVAHDLSSKINSVTVKNPLNVSTGLYNSPPSPSMTLGGPPGLPGPHGPHGPGGNSSPRGPPKINHREALPVKDFKFRPNHLGPTDLDSITDKDIDFSRALMVHTISGKYELFIYVRHNDHWDLLPYEYISRKLDKIPGLIYNGMKIN